jgi:hypothetical protein
MLSLGGAGSGCLSPLPAFSGARSLLHGLPAAGGGAMGPAPPAMAAQANGLLGACQQGGFGHPPGIVSMAAFSSRGYGVPAHEAMQPQASKGIHGWQQQQQQLGQLQGGYGIAGGYVRY